MEEIIMKHLRIFLIVLSIVIFLPSYVTSQNKVDFESQPLGTKYGAAINSQGDVIFTESDIPVSVHEFFWDPTTTHFGTCEIVNAIPGFGTDHIMSLNNINLRFDFTHLGEKIFFQFEFADLGGFENLEINGHHLFIDELSSGAPGHPAPDVTLYISTIPITGGMKSSVLLYGKVDHLLIGGQEFFIDNVSVPIGSGGELIHHCVRFESQHLGTEFGAPAANFPGQIIFEEDAIPVSVHHFNWGTGTGFNFCQIVSASPDFGESQIMMVNNINLQFYFNHFGPTNYVRLEFADLGGMENLGVNGHPVYLGDLSIAPGNPAPGVSWYISRDGIPGGMKASVILFGNVDSLLIGGQEFFLDNICAFIPRPIRIDDISKNTFQPKAYQLFQNYPNPFNPVTEIRFQLPIASHVIINIYNIVGEYVCTLIDSDYEIGYHNVFWHGKDKLGNDVTSGIYFYQLIADDFFEIKKMSLIR